MDKKYKKEKRVFEKHKQKLYKHEKEIYSFFKIEFWPKKRPLRDAARPKKTVFEKHRQGGHKKGLHKRDGKKKVMDGLSL